ncbi:MAG TPA: hypothetical protein VFI87_06395 [Hyphomicrobiaceae bacterium]|nr:hypothetical protein [Hyphomicrobiaceae bacterium]
MTEEDRRARGFRAQAALDEFVAPVAEQMRAEFMAHLSKIALNEPWEAGKMTKLAVGLKVIDTVEQQMRAAIQDGTDAARKITKAREIERLPGAQKKWLRI